MKRPGSRSPKQDEHGIRVIASIGCTLLAVGLIAAAAQGCARGGAEAVGNAPAPSPTATVTVTATRTHEIEVTATQTREIRVTATATVHETVTEDAPAQGGAPGEFYENCDEARAAGAAPVDEADPGYGPHLDRDRDGVGCE